MMTTRVSLAQVNAFLWHKQHLTPSDSPSPEAIRPVSGEGAGGEVLNIVHDICALHSTAAPTPYLSLWARLPGFHREDLDSELYERRRLVRWMCMRQTVHIVPTERVAIFHGAMRPRLETRAQREMGQLLVRAGLCQPGAERHKLQELQEAIAQALTQGGPLTAAELSAAIPALQARLRYAADKAYAGEMGIASQLLPRLGMVGFLVRTQPRGTWRSNLYEYALRRDWLPGADLQAYSTAMAQVELLRLYLAALGPATADDIAWWAGWSKSEARRALSGLGRAAQEIGVQGLDTACWLLASEEPALRATQPLAAGYVKLLPSLDPYIMGYRDRRRFLDPQHYDQVFDRSGNAFPTVWLDGRVVGIWREIEAGIECLLWQELDGAALVAEATRLGSFLCQGDTGVAAAEVKVTIRPYPPDWYVKTPFTLGKR